jgi:hypothetical protein
VIALFSFGEKNHSTFNPRRTRPVFTPIPLSIILRRPLLPVEVCAALAGQDRAAIVNAITTGEIRYAFDLRTPGASKPAVRVLATSLRDWIKGTTAPACVDTPAALQSVIADLWPALSESVRTENVARTLGISLKHLGELAHCGLVQVVKQGAPGRNNHSTFSRRALVQFLIARRLQ